jgi:hypothetical protein
MGIMGGAGPPPPPPRPFQRYITSPKFPKISTGKTKENFCSCLANAEQAGQKNCNGKTTMFSTSALKESQASSYYWQCLLVRIGWSIL